MFNFYYLYSLIYGFADDNHEKKGCTKIVQFCWVVGLYPEKFNPGRHLATN